MKGIARIATMSAWISQWADQLQELHWRTGPAMGEDQRQGIGLGGAHMHEVYGLTIDLGCELRDLIESGLVLAPVVAGTPIVGQFLEVVKRNASAPADAGQL